MHAKVLITGSRGFVGQHVTRYLATQGLSVVGVGRQAPTSSVVSHPLVTYVQTDWSLTSLQTVLDQVQPDFVMHFAGATDVGASWRQPLDFVEANTHLSIRLLESIRTTCSGHIPRVLLVGTMHEYDLQQSSGAFTEESPTRPSSPYGWSKLLQSMAAAMYAQSFSIPVVLARVFNLIGPSANKGICAQLIHRAACIARHGCPPVYIVGSPDVARDFLDVRDAARAFWLLLQTEAGTSGQVFNVCSGAPTRLGEVIAVLNQLMDQSCATHIDASLVRAGEPVIAFGSHAKLSQCTGWNPHITLASSVAHSLVSATHATQKGE